MLGRNDNRIVNLSQYLSPTLAFIYVNLLFWDMWNPTLCLMFAMESEGSSLDHDVMEILIKGHTHREVDELMLVNNTDCTYMPALVDDQEVEEGKVLVDDYTDLPALIAISDHEVEIRPDGMDQKKSVDWKSSDCIVVQLGLGK